MADQAESGKGKNAKKKPFKLTRQLIRLAMNDGWNQNGIAEKCRVQQSIVSAWSRGAKFATEAQLTPLLEIYGHKLRRNAFRVYWALDTSTHTKTFFRVEGKVVFSEVIFELKKNGGKALSKIPLKKFIVHHQGGDSFRCVTQHRLEVTSPIKSSLSGEEDAVWSSEVWGQQSSAELIDWFDAFAHEISEENPTVGLALPFLLRQALMNHGFPVGGVVEYPAIW